MQLSWHLPSRNCQTMICVREFPFAGLRLDFWRSGESIGASKPLVTNRMEPGFNLTFALQDLYPNISLATEYAMQLHGYMALPNGTTSLQIVHAAGQATLHIGHCLFQVSDASGSGPPTLSRGTNTILPSLMHGRLYHVQVTLTCAVFTSRMAQGPSLHWPLAALLTMCTAAGQHNMQCMLRSNGLLPDNACVASGV